MAKKIKIKSGNENYESVSLTEYLNAIKIAKADGNINIRGKHYLPDTAELYANGNVTETETSPLSTANAIAITRRSLVALAQGDILEVAILESNTGAATLSIDGGAPIAINLDGAPLPAGSLERGSYVNFIYNGVSVDRESDATVATAKAVGAAIAAQCKYVTAQFNKSADTTLADIPGLSANVEANSAYEFEARISTNSDISGGVKFAISNSVVPSNSMIEIEVNDAGVQKVPLNSRIGGPTAVQAIGEITAVTTAVAVIKGLILTGPLAGTLTVQFAQNANEVNNSSVLFGSTLIVRKAVA